MNEIQKLTDEDLASLNPGIRHTVKTLREWGFETMDSGDSSTAQFECDLKCPYVHIKADPLNLVYETERLKSMLAQSGIRFDSPPNPQDDPDAFNRWPNIEASFLPLQGRAATIHLFNVIIPEKP